MGTFSIWHWLIVSTVLSFFGVPALAIATERSEKLLPRLKFLWWVLGVLVCSAVLGTIGEASGLTGERVAMFVFAMILWVLIAQFLLYRVAVQRLRDAGHGKGPAYLGIVPGLRAGVTKMIMQRSRERGRDWLV